MTNREKYAEEILDIACNYGGFAVDFKTGKPVVCDSFDDCRHCLLATLNGDCDKARKYWSEQKYTESPVDWNKVKVDTPIVVADYEGVFWTRRYFAKYDDGAIYAWASGKTSWTTAELERWNFARLVESEVNNDIYRN